MVSLQGWARDSGANLVLTTQKDSVKLRTLTLGPVPLRALRIGLEIMEGLSALETVLEPTVPGRACTPESREAVPKT